MLVHCTSSFKADFSHFDHCWKVRSQFQPLMQIVKHTPLMVFESLVLPHRQVISEILPCRLMLVYHNTLLSL